MKKTLVFGFALAFSITPLSAFAAVNSINGLTAADQSLVSPNSGATNTMHMDIITVGTDTHRFKWDGTPWRVDQGGTGWANFTAGALIYGNGTGQLATTTPATLGQILQSNGTFPTWVSTSSLGIVAQAAGSDREIQFNQGGNLSSNSQLKVNINAPGYSPGLISPAILGADLISDFGQNIFVEPGRIQLGPPVIVPDSRIDSGSVSVESGDISVPDETDYPGGIFASSAQYNSGGIQTDNGAAEAAGILMSGGKWENGIGWTGGSMRIFVGGAQLIGGGSSDPVIGGRLSIADNHTQSEAFLDISPLEGSIQTFSFPNFSGTFGLLEVDQTWTGNNTFSKGTGTTTVTFGTPGDATSHVCFNTKNTDGADISFYFVGTSMVVENNACQ
jgi:hypothetical protein